MQIRQLKKYKLLLEKQRESLKINVMEIIRLVRYYPHLKTIKLILVKVKSGRG